MLRTRLSCLLTLSLSLGATACGDDGTECNPECPVDQVCRVGQCVDPSDPGEDSGVDPADAGDGSDAGTQVDGSIPQDGGSPEDAAVDAGFDPMVTAVTVTPTTATLVSIDGAQVAQVFTVDAEYDDGTTLTVMNPSVRVDPLTMGTFTSSTGVFTANGRVGGIGRLIATFEGVEGEAEVRVVLEQTELIGNTSTTVPALFDGPSVTDPNREADIVYPLDGAVMPQNVAPAEIQWLNSAPGDAFKITLIKPNVQVLAYYAQASDPNFTNSWEVVLDAWRRIAQSEPVSNALIRVDRWVAADSEIVIGTPVQIRFAQAALLGSIYYWDIQRGRIVRINDGTTNREEFMPSPQLGCIGCHAVSNNGRYMAGRMGGGDNWGAVFDLTKDLTTNPPPVEYVITATAPRWFFSTWNPMDDRLLLSVAEQSAVSSRRFELLDPFTGNRITPVSGTLPTGPVTHPAWSPDGTEIAYVGNTNTWGGANSTGDLFKLPVTGRDSFGEPVLVMTGTVPAGPPAGAAINYPTWSPDSEWIAFAHGNTSRSENGQSALYIVRRDGTGLQRLENASPSNETTNFQPRFSPFIADGYAWLTYLSRRDYGNNLVGTAGSGRQQLWVSAIKINPAPGEDPSEVPYWLPGQNTASRNISAFWAPKACLDVGETCGVDAECCTGECDDTGGGVFECGMPSNMCRPLGTACTLSEQCCDNLLCVGEICGG